MSDSSQMVLDQSVRRLAAVIYAEHNLPNLLGLVTSLAVDAVPEVLAGSVTLLAGRPPNPETVTATCASVRNLDDIGYRLRTGPALQAIEQGCEVRQSLPHPGWPGFSDAAMRIGYRGVWSLPIASAGKALGALNCYSSAADPWDSDLTSAAPVLASQAAVILANAHAVSELARGNATLREALETRTVIGQAQGILMAREKITPANAFDILRRASQRTNRKLRDIAADLVAGACPVGRP